MPFIFQDGRIKGMERLVKRYKRMEARILQTQGKQGEVVVIITRTGR